MRRRTFMRFGEEKGWVKKRRNDHGENVEKLLLVSKKTKRRRYHLLKRRDWFVRESHDTDGENRKE